MIRFLLIVVSLFSSAALAGEPRPWQLNFQEAASPIMQEFTALHNYLLVIIFAVAIFVMLLLAFVCVRFSAKRNPKPSTTSHHTWLEVIWTAVPVVIILTIALKSVPLIYKVDQSDGADYTLKVIGYQWYWGYQYPDFGDVEFDSYMIEDDKIGEGQLRLLSVDNPVVLPVGKKIRIQTTAADVIHAWAVPALGFKMDAIPGRLNESWLLIEKPGTYYGQCSELCGAKHAFMPVEIRAVPEEEFKAWAKAKQDELG